MLIKTITKEKVRAKRVYLARKLVVPAFSYYVVEPTPETEAEIQQKIDNAFDILFDAVMESEVVNNAQLTSKNN